MSENAAFASLTDLITFWRALTGVDEQNRATLMLEFASNYLRQIANNNSLNIDEKISLDTTGVYGANVKMVILAAVKRAMTTPIDAPPADSWSQSASPYSETMQFTNPSGDLYFKYKELELLGIKSISGKSQFGVLRGIR